LHLFRISDFVLRISAPSWRRTALAAVLALSAAGCGNLPYRHDPLYLPIRAALPADHANFYTPRNLGVLAAGFGAAAAMAHTEADENIRRHWQDNIHGDTLDDLAQGLRHVGEGEMVALAVTAYAAGTYAPEAYGADASRNWGQRTGRALLVGAPPLVAGQFLTGGGRPDESPAGSRWRPFEDANGVSGHTFMAAVPFLTAAHMTDDVYLKTALYAGSTLTGVARIHEDDHYASHVLLGWLIAYVATDAVTATERQNEAVEILPIAMDDGVGLGVTIRH
jgi:hypothetical protein